MDNNTAKLLEQLAQKLGTTSEYLWKVLLKQAPISASIDLAQFIAIVIFGIFLLKTHKYLMKKEDDEKYGDSRYDKYEMGAILPMGIACLIFVILFTISFCCLGDVVSGYFNPEYWALEKILSQIK